MKIMDVVHDYGDNRTSSCGGICRVRCFLSDNKLTVLLTELEGLNDGQSVTNAIEHIINSIVEAGLVTQSATYIEHYEGDDPDMDTFDIISLSPNTSWKSVKREIVLTLIGGDESELNNRSIQNKKIYEKADKISYRRDPFRDSVYIEEPTVIARKREIIDSMIPKASVQTLIDSGANERELQKLLKQDLSLIAEAYVGSDEYICFSEYPLDKGAIDFVIFSGRSRMDITLVEVKGANFNLVNSNHYGSFHHKVGEAAGQIQERLGIVYRNYQNFRQEAHKKRQQVLDGKLIHNAFVGPESCKQVDPNKDVNIRTIIIGGRTVNDLEESKKRHDYERNSTPPIRIESWDTWIRRLRR